MTENTTTPPAPQLRRNAAYLPYIIVVLVTAAITFGIAWLLTDIFQHKIEAKNPYIRFVDVNDSTTDPEQWGKNWPREYDGYLRTAEVTARSLADPNPRHPIRAWRRIRG